MNDVTFQLKKWTGDFGRKYTKRNTYSIRDLDEFYNNIYGVTRTALNRSFLTGMSKSSRILEVGCNVGNQLLCLQKAGFRNLYAIEPQADAVKCAQNRVFGATVITGNAFDIPFKDKYFDLVYTSGVLIHINPRHIKKALQEIYRCSNAYIWGFEYYAEKYEEISYRGYSKLLWKTNFPRLFTSMFPDLKVQKIKLLKYSENDNVDVMYLLRKTSKDNKQY